MRTSRVILNILLLLVLWSGSSAALAQSTDPTNNGTSGNNTNTSNTVGTGSQYPSQPSPSQIQQVAGQMENQLKLSGAGAAVYQAFSALMNNHVYWRSNPLALKNLSDTVGISTYLSSAVSFRRQLFYIPRGQDTPAQWRVVDSFSLRNFLQLPNLIELNKGVNDINNHNYFSHEFYFFLNVGINKIDDVISVRNIIIPDGENDALVLLKALTLPPLFRIDLSGPVTSAEAFYKFIVNGLSVKYMRDLMLEGDILIIPANYGFSVRGGATLNMPMDIFKAKLDSGVTQQNHFNMRLDKQAGNRLSFSLSQKDYRVEDWNVSLRAYFDLQRTRLGVIDILKQLPGLKNSEDHEISQYLAGHIDAPSFQDFADLVTRLHNGEITQEEFDHLIEGIVPHSSNSFAVKASQKITMFPLMVLAQYINSVMNIYYGEGWVQGHAEASAYVVELNNVDAFDYLQKMIDQEDSGFLFRFLNLAYKSRYNNLTEYMDDMDHIFERLYLLETDYTQHIERPLNVSVLGVKRLKTKEVRVDELSIIDNVNDRTRYDVIQLKNESAASLFTINATKDRKSMQVMSVIKYKPQDNLSSTASEPVIDSYTLKLLAQVMEIKPSRDVLDTNRASKKSSKEMESYQYFLENALSPLATLKALPFSSVKNLPTGEMGLELTSYLSIEAVDLILKSPYYDELLEMVTKRDGSSPEGASFLKRFLKRLKVVGEKVGAERYKAFGKLVVDNSNKLIKISAQMAAFEYLIGVENFERVALAKATLAYKDKVQKEKAQKQAVKALSGIAPTDNPNSVRTTDAAPTADQTATAAPAEIHTIEYEVGLAGLKKQSFLQTLDEVSNALDKLSR